jgi:hypothetical protein
VGAVLGVGGLVDFSNEGYELVHRTAVYAPPPYEKAMKMLVLPNQGEFTPQPWVPRDIATYTTFYFDVLNAFDNFGPLIEELAFQGEEGAWKESLEGLKEPTGPQIDVREELIEHLGNRISVLTDYQLPITTTSERLLFSIEAKEPRAVAKAIEKLFKNDPTWKRRGSGDQVIWEYVGDESPSTEAPPVITFGDAPPVAPPRSLRKMMKEKESEEEEEEERPPLLPHAAITIWEGNLIIASHMDFLMKVLAPNEKPDPLNEDVDYLLVNEEIKKFEPKEKCARLFSRTDEEYRPTYELVRQNKMPESETMLAKVLNGLFGEGKRGAARTQKIDGSKLPDYQVVRRYLGDAGLQATSEPEGWYLKGFTLTK